MASRGRGVRTWDNWPQSRRSGDPVRESLKALFSPAELEAGEADGLPPENGELAALADELRRAVELLGTAVERLEQHGERLARLPGRAEALVRRRLRELEGRVVAATAAEGRTTEEVRSSYLLFVAGDGGYRLVEREGAAPHLGTGIAPLEDGGYGFVVTRVSGSPLPGDRRRCAYLQAVPATRAADP